MNRKLMLLNLALLGVIVYAGVQFRASIRAAQARKAATSSRKLAVAPPPQYAPIPAQPPTLAAGYIDVAQKDLFDRSRNPNVPVEPPPPPPPPEPVPPLPVYHGMMNLFGDGPTAFLSLQGGGAHQGIKVGESIGPFKLVAVNSAEIVFEWKGQTIRKSVDEFLAKGAAPQSNSGPVERTIQPTVVAEPAVQKQVGPIGDVNTFGFKSCAQNDSYPAGAVVDGFRKTITQTAFGPACRWDPVGR